MKKFFLSITFLLVAGLNSGAQVVPAPQTQKHSTILLQNGRAHIGNGEYVNNASIGIENGKILFVENALTYKVEESEWDTIIDIQGKHIYPGFIAPNVTLGLTEIDAVRATRDFRETGSINPNVRSLIAFNTDSKVIYTVRTNGVLVCQSTPRGGLVSGSSSIMALDGWNWEDAVYKADDGIHFNWPKKYNVSGWWAEPGSSSPNEQYKKLKQRIYAFVAEAEAYCKKRKPDVKNLKYEAMREIFKGDKRIYFHTQYAPEINDIIDLSREFDLKHPVIVGGYDAHLLADRLKENDFTVILSRIHSLPKFHEDLPFAPYEIPYKLQEAGVLFCLDNSGDMEAMNTRNLPFMAGTAWSYGLSEEQAIASITLNAAKILGVDDRLGSLEKGKDATLFISGGNALDMMTNKAFLAMVKGRFIVLDNHQMQLSRKYHERYGLD